MFFILQICTLSIDYGFISCSIKNADANRALNKCHVNSHYRYSKPRKKGKYTYLHVYNDDE